LRRLVGLGQDGNAGLLQDVAFGHGRGLLGNISVDNPAAGGGKVLGDVLQIGYGCFKPVLQRPEIAAHAVDLGNGAVNRPDGLGCACDRADVYVVDRVQVAAVGFIGEGVEKGTACGINITAYIE